jgi:tRNA-5-methyluridine54 2-sulfurtransferase
MRCHSCRAPANVEIRRSRTAYCAGCYPAWFRSQVQERIDHERMFRRSQSLLVAVSGGKDSLALWHALTELGYRADGMYIRLGIGDYSQRSQAKCEAFAEARGLTLHQVDLKDGQGFTVPDLLETRSGKPCAACGTVKRYHFNKLAADLGYDVVATGHNLDDEAAVLFGNVLRWQTEYLGRQLPVLPAAHGFPRKVKPLVRLAERETAAWCVLRGIDYQVEECPNAVGNKHLGYKAALNDIEDASPGSKHAFYFGFLDKVSAHFTPEAESDREGLRPCTGCGAPTTDAELCAFCKLVARVTR